MVSKISKIVTRRSKSVSPYANIDWEKASALFKKDKNITGGKGKLPSTKDILKILAGVGAIGMVFIFPGAAPALGALVLGQKQYTRWQTKQVISGLGKRKYVKIEYLDDGRVRVKITKRGFVRALTYEIESMHLNKPKIWDRRWRVVIFDIPKKYGRVRDLFRMRIRQLGLYQLQESVYVSPTPCFNEIEFLRELYGVSFTVQYLLVERLEDDQYLRDHFELS
ncbi:hypothetical protein HY945_00165 [Candidatus Gottesmanbacteria bacterium]|nr:hypothetical protein [Candidatus Gottesmanbacteria bacterium]